MDNHIYIYIYIERERERENDDDAYSQICQYFFLISNMSIYQCYKKKAKLQTPSLEFGSRLILYHKVSEFR